MIQRITIQCAGGQYREIEADVRGDYAVHRAHGVPWGFTVTDVVSGLAMHPWPLETEAEAIAWAARLAHAPLPG